MLVAGVIGGTSITACFASNVGDWLKWLRYNKTVDGHLKLRSNIAGRHSNQKLPMLDCVAVDDVSFSAASQYICMRACIRSPLQLWAKQYCDSLRPSPTLVCSINIDRMFLLALAYH